MNRTLPRRPRGFTLLEIMIVVTIIGFLATMAIQTFRRVRDVARRNATVNDLRVFSGAFEQYALQHAAWPVDRMPGIFPEEMDGLVSRSGWTRRVPIGGRYDWNVNVGGFRAAIAIVDDGSGPPPTLEQFQEIDRQLDDGDLTRGLVQFVWGGLNVVLEQ